MWTSQNCSITNEAQTSQLRALLGLPQIKRNHSAGTRLSAAFKPWYKGKRNCVPLGGFRKLPFVVLNSFGLPFQGRPPPLPPLPVFGTPPHATNPFPGLRLPHFEAAFAASAAQQKTAMRWHLPFPSWTYPPTTERGVSRTAAPFTRGENTHTHMFFSFFPRCS